MSDLYTDESRKSWRRDGPLQPGDLQTGCLQRIAAAMELSCKDREKLERDYAFIRKARDLAQERADRLARSNSALRGVIKRMKRLAAK
jgi:hypothetical protein